MDMHLYRCLVIKIALAFSIFRVMINALLLILIVLLLMLQLIVILGYAFLETHKQGT